MRMPLGPPAPEILRVESLGEEQVRCLERQGETDFLVLLVTKGPILGYNPKATIAPEVGSAVSNE